MHWSVMGGVFSVFYFLFPHCFFPSFFFSLIFIDIALQEFHYTVEKISFTSKGLNDYT